MAKMLIVINVPVPLTQKQMDMVKRRAEKQLGKDFKVLVAATGVTVHVTPLSGAK